MIHSFWVPNLQGKIDLMPGRLNELWLQADRPGVYRGQCAEFCGLQHANMALVVVAEPPAEFERWLAGNRAPAPAPVTPDQQRGKDGRRARPVRDVPHHRRHAAPAAARRPT